MLPTIPISILGPAETRVGQTAKSRANWLLRFAKAKLEVLNEEEKSLLLIETLIFMGRTDDASRSHLPNVERLAEWQAVLGMGLKKLSRGNSWEIPVQGRIGAKGVKGQIEECSVNGPARQDHWPFAYHALNVIIEGADLLRFCLNPPCGKAYIRNKRQNYCSQRCRNAVNKRIQRGRA